MRKTDSYGVKFTKNILSGGAAGAMSLCFVYSLDYARTRLANDAKAGKGGGSRQFNELIDVYRKTLQSNGFVGLYDTLKPILLGDNAGVFISFVLGYVVTISAGLVSYPIDTIRRCMMMTSGQAVSTVAHGIALCMSFMKGAGANILRGVAGAGVLAGFDKFKELYIYWRTGRTCW